MVIDGVIFDLDGTLWDTCRVVSESWGETLRRSFGVDTGPDPAAVRSIMGMTAAQIAAALFGGFGPRAEEVCLRCIREENDYIARRGGDLYPGVPGMLAALAAERPLFIVSNCLDGYIECFLSSSGLGAYFSGHACEGATGLEKAGNLALIRARHSLRCPVYVGDTALDEQSARAAHMPFIHAAYGFGSAAAPDAAIRAPAELMHAIRELEVRHV